MMLADSLLRTLKLKSRDPINLWWCKQPVVMDAEALKSVLITICEDIKKDDRVPRSEYSFMTLGRISSSYLDNLVVDFYSTLSAYKKSLLADLSFEPGLLDDLAVFKAVMKRFYDAGSVVNEALLKSMTQWYDAVRREGFLLDSPQIDEIYTLFVAYITPVARVADSSAAAAGSSSGGAAAATVSAGAGATITEDDAAASAVRLGFRR